MRQTSTLTVLSAMVCCVAQGEGAIMRPKSSLSLFSHLALFQDLKCYVPGQCQEFLVDFQASQDPDECGKFCHDHNANLQDGDVHRCL